MRAERLATMVLAMLVVYLLLVTALDDPGRGGVALSLRQVVLWSLVAAVGLRVGIRQAVARRVVLPGTLPNISLLGGALLVSFLAADLAVAAYLGVTAPPPDLAALATRDSNTFIMELYPRLYYPTPSNFRLHKPGVSVSGSHYGGLYLPSMLRSRTLVDSVLTRQQVSIRINALGLREGSPLEGCEIFALGDSFTFGWGVTDGAVWPDRLEQRLGRCVYNLGIHDASPMQELLLLEYVLSRSGRAHPRHLVWAIFEGNDLEDSYAEAGPGKPPGRLERATRNTVFDLERLRAFVVAISKQSIVHHLRTGELRFAAARAGRPGGGQFQIDGVELVNPLSHLPRLGFVLLPAHQLVQAARPREYLLHHPNRPRLDRVFLRMARLSDSLHFGVTVLIIPSSVRAYAPYLELTPAPAPEAYFADYVDSLSRARGFDVLNLLEVFPPYLERELLYFRDDGHLNARGHEVVASVLAHRLTQAGSK